MFILIKQPSNDIELFTLKPRIGAPKYLTGSDIDEDILPIIARARQGFWKEHICEQLINTSDLKNSRLGYFHLLTNGPDEFLKPLSLRKVNHAEKVLSEHRLHRWTQSMSLSDTLAFVDAIEVLSKKIGLWIFAILEHGYHDLESSEKSALRAMSGAERDIWLEQYVLQKHHEMINAKTKEPLLPLLQLRSGFIVKELVNPLDLAVEGTKMHHCVFGYLSEVNNGSSRIVSLQKHKTSDCLTLELRKINLIWDVVQAKGVFNRDTSKDEDASAGQISVLLNVCGILRLFPFWLRKMVCVFLINSPSGLNKLALIFSYIESVAIKQRIGNSISIRLKLGIDGVLFGEKNFSSRYSAYGTTVLFRSSSWKEYLMDWKQLVLLRLKGIKPSTQIKSSGNRCSSGFDDMCDDLPF